jgi:hypothetical protein
MKITLRYAHNGIHRPSLHKLRRNNEAAMNIDAPVTTVRVTIPLTEMIIARRPLLPHEMNGILRMSSSHSLNVDEANRQSLVPRHI